MIHLTLSFFFSVVSSRELRLAGFLHATQADNPPGGVHFKGAAALHFLFNSPVDEA